MKMLTKGQYEAARDFLKSNSRNVDCALFEFRFENGDSGAVIEALQPYQNLDGGFGQALEPDLRSPSSSGLATAHALETLCEVGCDERSLVIRNVIQYLLETYDPDSKTWAVAPVDVNEYPHAPWWHDEAGSLSKLFNGYQVIPRTLILASLHCYHASLPEGWLPEVVEDTVQFIETAPVEALRSDGFVWASKLAQANGLASGRAYRLQQRLVQIVPEVVSMDPEEWSGYCLPPLKAAPSPNSLAAGQMSEEIGEHLDYTIRSQDRDGAWDPVWDWGDHYPDVWEVAREEWRGHLTLEYLTILRNYNRIINGRSRRNG